MTANNETDDRNGPDGPAEAPDRAGPEDPRETGVEARAETEAGMEAVPEEAGEPDAAAEIAELKDKLLRTLAEMENLRRRAQKDREDALKYAATNFARDMLSVADNLRRAIESIPEDGDPDSTAMTAFIEGVALTEKELLSALERHGITRIDPLGQKFDPQFHEAMFEAPVPGAENGTVFQVIETGYMISDRLLRPAKVGVAKAPAEPSGPGEQVDTTA